jgi:osmoprotectant transport system ATP-binding protein
MERAADEPARSEPVVAWRGVSKAYPGGPTVLDRVDLELRAGEILALLGASGSGKTTLLKLVNGLVRPTAGAVVVRGRPVDDWDAIALRRSIGYVIQDAGLMPHLTAVANVGLPLRIAGRPRGEWHEAAEAALRLVGLEPGRFGDRRPDALSGGQRQRVGVARALVTRPGLVLMDEPFGALDPILRRELQDEFRQLQQRLGTAVAFVTHDLGEAGRMADRVALLHAGRVEQTGAIAELLERPASQYARAFVEASGVGPWNGRAGAGA